MARFQCIADKCEDTCCAGGLIVELEPEDVAQLESAMGGTPEGRAALEKAIIRPEGASNPGFLTDGQSPCHFLTKNLLCGVIARGHPASAMPTVCHLFPRRFVALPGEGIQMVASMACPEAARLALWADDGLELQALLPSASAAFPAIDPMRPVAPYVELAAELQAWGLRRLADSQVPLSRRLMAIAELGHRVDDVFNRGADGPLEPLRQAMADLERPEELEQALPRLPKASVPVLRAIHVWLTRVQTVLPTSNPRSAKLIGAALQRWRGEACALEGVDPGTDPGPAAIAKAHKAARDRLGDAAPQHELYLQRYATANWLEQPYSVCKTVGESAFRLATRVAMARTLLLFHPGAGEPGGLPAAAVEAIQIYARHVERDGSLHQAMDQSLSLEELYTDMRGRTALFAGLC